MFGLCKHCRHECFSWNEKCVTYQLKQSLTVGRRRKLRVGNVHLSLNDLSLKNVYFRVLLWQPQRTCALSLFILEFCVSPCATWDLFTCLSEIIFISPRHFWKNVKQPRRLSVRTFHTERRLMFHLFWQCIMDKFFLNQLISPNTMIKVSSMTFATYQARHPTHGDGPV